MIHPADECRDHKFGGDNNDGSPEDIFTNCESIEGLPSNSFITISAFRGVTNELEEIYKAALVATEPRERKTARAKLHGLLDRHVESVNTVLSWRDPVPNIGKDLSDALLRFRRETDTDSTTSGLLKTFVSLLSRRSIVELLTTIRPGASQRCLTLRCA
jgi:hypothetical protein